MNTDLTGPDIDEDLLRTRLAELATVLTADPDPAAGASEIDEDEVDVRPLARRHSPPRRWIAAAAAVAVVGGAIFAAAQATDERARVDTDPGAVADDGPLADPDPPSPEEVEVIQDEVPRAQDLSDALTALYPSSFAAVDVIRETQEVVLRFDEGAEAPDPEAVATVAAEHGYPSGSYTLGTATWTRSELLGAEQLLVDTYPDGTITGTSGRIVGFGIVEDRGVLQVGVADIDPGEAAGVIARTIPAELLEVTAGAADSPAWQRPGS